MEITRHFTATTIIVHEKKALLHLHKRLGYWLPAGGHIDRDELPEEAALREVKEETGLEVKLYTPDKEIEMDDVRDLVRPMHVLLENINQFHQHIDFVYYATPVNYEINPQDGESNNLRWFTAEELKDLSGAPDNVKILSIEAINLLG